MDIGHEIIIAGDFNDDLNNRNCTTVTFMRNLGLKELLLTSNDGKALAAYVRGSMTIDEQGRYSSFHMSPASDHQWITVYI
jgi:hypothetical protein